MEFDSLGRVKTYRQETDGQSYDSKYEYNLSGALVAETYPSGRVVRNFLESDGDLKKITSKAGNSIATKTFADSFNYTAAGAIEHLKLGNGRWESAKFNNRLQITELALGTNATDGSLWKVNYDYSEIDVSGTLNPNKNTGNIAKQTISYNGLAAPFIQSYRYDSLDRLIEAKETNNANPTWHQQFGYDRFGNRIGFAQTVGGQTLTVDSKILPTVDAATNRFNTADFEYDANGNVIRDAQNKRFTFNGDNKQIEVRDGNNSNQSTNLLGQYFYDADGKRVKKVVPNGETTIFVYSGGKLVAEYSTVTPTQTAQISYTASDVLGSPRVITNQAGGVTSRRDFMPFGEDLVGANVGRDGNIYSADAIRKKFTGYEKDTETGLDFAEARMYHNSHGRFTAVDPLLASGKSADPQTFNRYVYVLNSPLTFVDPDGLNPKKWYRAKIGNMWDYKLRDKSPGKDYREYTGKKVVVSENYYWRLTNTGAVPIKPVLPPTAKEKRTKNQEQANETAVTVRNSFAGAVDAADPTGGFIRRNILPLTVDESSREYQNANSGSSMAQVVFGAKGLLSGGAFIFGGALKSGPTAAKNFSVAYEMTLDTADFGKYRGLHFNRANTAMKEALDSSPEFAGQMETLIPGIGNFLSDTKMTGRSPTDLGWVWHHNTKPGVMQLVPTTQHRTGSIFWETLHDVRVNGRSSGGYRVWAVPNGAPRN